MLPRATRFVPGQVERLGQRGVNALGHPQRVRRRGEVLEQHHELVTADARHVIARDAGDGVDLARARRQPPRHLDEQLVAHLVPEAVVDDLELVEVDVEQREPALGIAVVAGQAVGQAIRQQAAVREARQRVVHRLEAELLLGQLAVGDVGQRAGGAQRVALGVLDDDPAAQHPAVLTVSVADPKLRRQVLVLLAQVGVQVGLQPRQIVGVDAVQPLVEAVGDLRLLVSQHRLPARRAVDAAGLDVPVPEAVVGAAGGQAVAVLRAFALLHLVQEQILRGRQGPVALEELGRRQLHGALDQLALLLLLLVCVAHRLQQPLELRVDLTGVVFPELTFEQSVHVVRQTLCLPVVRGGRAQTSLSRVTDIDWL